MSRASLPREAREESRAEIRVWDPVVRIFHWTVAVGCFVDLFILEDGKGAHRAIGYIVAFALVARLLWGFIGSKHARFADFVPTPTKLGHYLQAVMRKEEPRYIGHNPAGAVVMLTLMGLLAAVSVTGWMLTLDANFGSKALEELHEGIANLILALAGLHAVAAIYEGRRHNENLVWAMVTGRKRA
ncbi:cytochrome b/b6 domain-containing protein [Methylocystis bryophila]|uniref:Cytochrome B n=1 Tax=Methylocystis bryophila TaxID=655015 RepID=A0A1W6MRC4_9HYPH|nr:cytochrome b/b6 domain-containing protein [Methylocystis bryophila]ARN80127.1 cytochrome B [Methylocystis bryophila]BDV40069.1 cytochrome b561 [Methylocystis bryophila]